ncbi:ATP-grasp domain-containing protein [Paucibacter sp. R3-3]|uniref:ATP-grasp domain-containing protein n=1 Tax=Roseateles agri TaxID=3098619 RepID=A0ABU5DR51_9BURK|nr:ATP-grasp domain-containing protein [Paucibacter sp. R3-3]MDY0748802.1 ATP-grasp domain-containing protein [Paucibacter sp. R3-3]
MRIAVAGLSARLMAEAAARAGHEVVALDLFGDLDTRAAAVEWHGIGEPAELRIDGARLLDALQGSGAQAWIAGSGFEAQPALLARAAALCPLLGTAPEDAARIREPALFFGLLTACDIEHPRWGVEVPRDGRPWLRKNAWACGGTHVERVAAGARQPSPHHYFQQEVAGPAMSATFEADGRCATVLGVNEMILAPGSFAFRGVIGPVPVPPALTRKIDGIVQRLTESFRLRGPCSLDFIRTGEASLSALEVNARPPASMALYPANGEVRGLETVFARRAGEITRSLAKPGVHDVPQPGTRYAAGDPVCSVSAAGPDAAAVRAKLAAAREALLDSLEKSHV